MKKNPPPEPLYDVRLGVDALTPEQIEETERMLSHGGALECVSDDLRQMLEACQLVTGDQQAHARELAQEILHFQHRLQHPQPDELAELVHLGMVIACKFELLLANVQWTRAARVGERVIAGPGRAGTDPAVLIAWAKEKMANGQPLRGLAGQAHREKVIDLSERQIREHLRLARQRGELPPKT